MRAILDHIVVDVRDRLDEAAATFERLGFTVNDPSENSFGMINRLCVLRNAYIELLGAGPRASGERRDWSNNPAGGNGLVFRTADAETTAAEFERRGLAVGARRTFSRPVLFDGVPGEARFDTVHFSLPDAAPLRTYFCRHYTPELIWREPSMRHANGAFDLARAGLVARDPATIGGRLAQIFDGAGGAEASWLVDADNAEIAVQSEVEFAAAFGPQAAPDARSCAVRALTIRTSTIDVLAEFVRGSGLRATYAPDRVVVQDDAYQLVFEFLAATAP